MKLLKKISFTFILLLLSYCVLLTLSFCIPNKMIESKVDTSLQMIEKEGMYPTINEGNDKSTKLDNFTDHLMIRKTMARPELSPLENAMTVDGYPRYWHGYLVFLRPMLMFMSLGNLRMIYATVLFLLLGLTFYFLIKRSDIFFAISFLISLSIANVATFFFSMQFSNILIVTLLATLLLLAKIEWFQTKTNLFLYFFIIGSVANFFDLLTIPLVSWGIPITIFSYVTNKYTTDKKESLGKQLETLVGTGVFWGIGYGLTWFFKWAISSVILRQNVIKDAIKQILFRTEGNNDYPLARVDMLKLNVDLMYTNTTLLILGLTCVFFLYYSFKKRGFQFSWGFILAMVFIALTPYIWYNVLANHSQIHFWFTYRVQILTTFALLSIFAFLIPANPLQETTYSNENK
ncbi:MAG: hypothetical protein ACLR3E_08190 [Enterococcus durans]